MKARNYWVTLMDMQVVILAGGLATRLGDLARNRPKSMLRIRGKPFLEYQLELLQRGGIKNIVLCIGHMGEQIERRFGDGRRYGVNIMYSLENRLLGTAGALKKAEHLLDNVFFTMYGDSYLSMDFPATMRYFKSRNKLALMTVYKNCDRYDRSNTVVEGNLVKKFSKKEALNMIPENQFYSLDDLFPRLIEMGELLAFEVKERFYEIGSPQGLMEFEHYIKERNDTLQSAN